MSTPENHQPRARCRVRFAGRVQGVGFRATTRELARRCSVSGWVRNEPDGTVLLEAQADAAGLERFLQALRAERAAFIQREMLDRLPPVDGEDDFRIDR